MKNPCEGSKATRRCDNTSKKNPLISAGIAAVALGMVVSPAGDVWADEFPPYPERSEAFEICKQAVADFYNGKPTKAATEFEMSRDDVVALRNIWLEPNVKDDQFVNLVTADYVKRNAKRLKVAVDEKKFPPIPFLGLTFSVNLPENKVDAELECMFRSYGKAWKLKDLKLGRKGTRVFTTYPVTMKSEFPGFPYK